MTKKELKSIIKECIREIVFEENFLSPLISEIATGVSSNTHTINEVKTNTTKPSKAPNYNKISHARKKLLDGIGSSALGGVDVFKDVSAEHWGQKGKKMGKRNRTINFEISSKDVPNPERMIRRFMKKVSKLKILEEYVERTSFYKKPSQIKNEKKRRVKRELKKQRIKNKNT